MRKFNLVSTLGPCQASQAGLLPASGPLTVPQAASIRTPTGGGRNPAAAVL